MRSIRVYQAGYYDCGDELVLDARASHHLTTVLRLRETAKINVFDGNGNEFNATIIAIQKKATQIKLANRITAQFESPVKIHLLQGVSRGEKMDWVIQKAVECGVNSITPVLTERCGVSLTKERWQKRVDHWQGVIISATQQCGRNVLTQLDSPQTLTATLKLVPEATGIIFHPTATTKLSDYQVATKQLMLAIGPEGGFSAAEVQACLAQGLTGVNLGPRVLRTETATVAALSVMQYKANGL